VVVTPEYNAAAAADCDVIIVEHGKPLEVTHQGIKNGALIIDAGFHWFNNRTCGNVDRDDLLSWEGYLLPVPGGLGPLLIAYLMKNLTKAARKQ
jgi:methylenetetrahydrofolate dehydrogenase (NADP+)/methenyltetrahydrofolate cyclohydrolase